MTRRPPARRLAAALLGVLALAPPARAETLRVFAAASLTEAFGELAAEFERAHPGVAIEVSFAGSQVLRTQIEQGAPAAARAREFVELVLGEAGQAVLRRHGFGR